MKALQKMMCIFLCAAVVLGFSSCSKNVEMTEENVSQTVETVETALREFDTKTLKKYVESETLSYILKFAESKEQFADLGRAIFSALTLEAQEIDLEKGTVTVKVVNRSLSITATMFVHDLTNLYKGTALLSKLNDDDFLDKNLSKLNGQIEQQPIGSEETVTLKVAPGKKNLVLTFDETAENAVSGGALGAVKSFTGGFSLKN